jgi:competence protein ComEC
VTAAAVQDLEAEVLPSWMERQLAMQRDTVVLWSPVFLIVGIWIYFALPVEPSLVLCGFLLAVLAGVSVAALCGHMRRSGLVLVLVFGGLLLAKFHTLLVAAPLLPASTEAVRVAGTVESIELRSGGRSIVNLAVHELDDVAPLYMPQKLRLMLARTPMPLRPGQFIEGRAYLRPLPVPVLPGGFDYGRQLYLSGIGGVGRFSGDVVIRDPAVPVAYWLRAEIHDVRRAIGQRIHAVLPGGQGSFAEALITGERGGITKATNESLQISGLAHVLSISGLHMSLVAGGVFWLVRALLALSPTLALHQPIKKWAAGAAMLAGFAYMLLAGADVATQRSYLMLAVVFLAVIADRPAISIRNLSLAALIILVTQPAAAVSASFHMSFMAVMGLAAAYEAYGTFRAGRLTASQPGPLRRAVNATALAVTGMAVSTLVAGTLSSIPAAHHFGRVAPLSLVSNLLALPVISLIVMPAATLSVLLMPFGFETFPLLIMGRGLDMVMLISDSVAGMAGSRMSIPLLPLWPTIVMCGGTIWLCLWRGSLRLAGLAAVLTGMMMAPIQRLPDLLVEHSAANAAMRNIEGKLVPVRAGQGSFAVGKWLQAEGDEATPALAAKRSGWICRESICRTEVKGKRVAFIGEGGDARRVCNTVDIVIADHPLRGACQASELRIERFDVWRNGAYAVFVGDAGAVVMTSRGLQGERPWRVTPVARRELAGAGVIKSGARHSRDVPAALYSAYDREDDNDNTGSSRGDRQDRPRAGSAHRRTATLD